LRQFAVAGGGGQREIVGNGIGEGRAEHRQGRGEDKARLVGRLVAFQPDGFEKSPAAVEVDLVALLEIGFGIARHDGGEVEDHIGALGYQGGGDAVFGKIRDNALAVIGATFGDGTVHHIHQGEAGDGFAAQRLVARQPFDQLAPDHTARAGDQNLHVGSSLMQFFRPRP